MSAAPGLLASIIVLAWISGWWFAMLVADRRRAKAIASVESKRLAAEAEAERLRGQLAICGVAARDDSIRTRPIPRGERGWSAAYQDVVDLRREANALIQAREQAIVELNPSAPIGFPIWKRAREILVASRGASAFTPAKAASRFKTTGDVVEFIRRQQAAGDALDEPESE